MLLGDAGVLASAKRRISRIMLALDHWTWCFSKKGTLKEQKDCGPPAQKHCIHQNPAVQPWQPHRVRNGINPENLRKPCTRKHAQNPERSKPASPQVLFYEHPLSTGPASAPTTASEGCSGRAYESSAGGCLGCSGAFGPRLLFRCWGGVEVRGTPDLWEKGARKEPKKIQKKTLKESRLEAGPRKQCRLQSLAVHRHPLGGFGDRELRAWGNYTLVSGCNGGEQKQQLHPFAKGGANVFRLQSLCRPKITPGELKD